MTAVFDRVLLNCSCNNGCRQCRDPPPWAADLRPQARNALLRHLRSPSPARPLQRSLALPERPPQDISDPHHLQMPPSCMAAAAEQATFLAGQWQAPPEPRSCHDVNGMAAGAALQPPRPSVRRRLDEVALSEMPAAAASLRSAYSAASIYTAPDLFDDLWHGPRSAWAVSALRHGRLLPAEPSETEPSTSDAHGRRRFQFKDPDLSRGASCDHPSAVAALERGDPLHPLHPLPGLRIPSSSDLSDGGVQPPPCPGTPPAAWPESRVRTPGVSSIWGGSRVQEPRVRQAPSRAQAVLWQAPLIVRSRPRTASDSRWLEVWLPDTHGTTAMMSASSCPISLPAAPCVAAKLTCVGANSRAQPN